MGFCRFCVLKCEKTELVLKGGLLINQFIFLFKKHITLIIKKLAIGKIKLLR